MNLISYVLENPDNPDNPLYRGKWNWWCLSRNKNITIKHVLQNPDKPWDWNNLSHNPNITIEDVLRNPDKDWGWSFISYNKFKYDTALNTLHLRKLKRIKCNSGSCNFKLYSVIKHPSQKFYKWYCGEGGIGREIDNNRQTRAFMIKK